MPDDPPIPSDLLPHFLRGRDVSCPGCQYNLRDLTAGRCPECGQELVLRLALAEPKLGAMLTGLIGLSTGAGFNALLLIYYAIMRFVLRPGMPGEKFLWMILGGFAVQGAALAAWLRFWSRIRRFPPAVRLGLALACCALPLVNIVLFSLTIL